MTKETAKAAQQRRTPEVTYTFEGEPGKYVRLEDYTHDVLQWVLLMEALESRMAELEAALEGLLKHARERQTATSRPHGVYSPDATDYAIQVARKALEPK